MHFAGVATVLGRKLAPLRLSMASATACQDAQRTTTSGNVLLTALLTDCSSEFSVTPRLSSAEVIRSISEKCIPDLVVTANDPPYHAFGRAGDRTHKLDSYHESAAESDRCKWAAGIGPVESVEALSGVIRRVTRHSSSVRLYDAFFTSSEGHSKRRNSLQLILENWFQSCAYPIERRSLDIFSSDHKTTHAGLSNLKTDLLSLQKDFPIKMEVRVMQNVNSILHPRHIQTSNFILLADPGLDFFDGVGGLRHILLKPARGDKEHLRLVRSLKTVEHVTLPVPRL